MARQTTSSTVSPAIVWFRLDLRLTDNPALTAAAESGRPVIPIYILDSADKAGQMGGASLWWLHMSLTALDVELRRRYRRPLVLRRGEPAEILPALIRETGAGAVYWNRRYEPAAITRDSAIQTALVQAGVHVATHNSALLFEPSTIHTKTGGWFRVFSPFWRACRSQPPPPPPQSAPASLAGWHEPVASETLASWRLLPSRPDWAAGLRETWQPGEAAAAARLARFIDGSLHSYADGRDRPGQEATSRLSPHLHFGEIGPRQVWHAMQMRIDRGGMGVSRNAEKLLAELGWREFAHHLLFHFPALPERNFRGDFDSFPWSDNAARLEAWRRGRTGYPIVDAGMRELWQTGWMHNRVRMITASFLIKHLRQDWRHGAAWFWDTLVDADLANNSAGWQWVAGSGADAAPYFRIFNPILQGEKFDPRGAYVRRWVPELAGLPDQFIHKPWQAPPLVLSGARLELGRDYPEPMVDHDRARKAALAAFARLRNDTGEAAGAP